MNIIEGHKEETNNVSNHEEHFIKMRSLHMHAALSLAIDNVPDKTWRECCEMEFVELNNWGRSYLRMIKIYQDIIVILCVVITFT